MRWRREDSAYAAATSVVGVLVVYLVAGNFGLIPSPLAPSGLGDRARVGIPGVFAVPSDTNEPTVDPTDGGSPSPTVGPRTPTPLPPVDTRAPAVTIQPPAEPVVVSSPENSVEGSATDDVSGIARVVVTYEGAVSEASTVLADLDCSTALKCTWSAHLPVVPDSYEVRAKAFDRSGNSAVSDTVSVTVIAPPAVPEPGDLPELL